MSEDLSRVNLTVKVTKVYPKEYTIRGSCLQRLQGAFEQEFFGIKSVGYIEIIDRLRDHFGSNFKVGDKVRVKGSLYCRRKKSGQQLWEYSVLATQMILIA